jgi:hypothetical protein
MRSSSSIPRFARLGSLLALGVFGVHQLRYLLAYGDASSATLSAQGHEYLAGAVPFLVALGLAALLATLLGARFGSRVAESSLPRRCVSYGLAMLAIYCCQELVEGTLSAGHPAGIAALLAGGGWIAAPLALLLGSAAALAMRGLDRVEALIAPAERARPRLLPPRATGAPRRAPLLSRLLSPLAFGMARRPPPAPVRAH